ncbi:hypothetical protein IU443_21450 [Nocardia farcinica]|uniref:hypothetical protein n=2 Tax=Nocardia farcinica TaxID=37329 RepID=UPI001896269A|nr:hypothetical protein [Nocardia farcinica]MBF6264840.1 hypothetical protein [Nocardia farcinica]MBF6283626.1 hypothetical protein [Nocardia farcinica]MBF6307421.1 hypothetical protein [Nocardia farcinica]MBF6392512.1 hypothetical protein [Nocardia farcinica]MBF6526874.1 hypothetical protein [Nocardia farcinica]
MPTDANRTRIDPALPASRSRAIAAGHCQLGIVRAEVAQLARRASGDSDQRGKRGEITSVAQGQRTVAAGMARAVRATPSTSAATCVHGVLLSCDASWQQPRRCRGKSRVQTLISRFIVERIPAARLKSYCRRHRFRRDVNRAMPTHSEQDGEPTLSMQDIAELAKVQRPVVSMWRKRDMVRGESIPFPQPVVDGPVPRFRRDAVLDWLERTGRGNNADHRLDAPTVSAPDNVGLEDLVTLLALAVAEGRKLTGLSHADLVAAAREIDPADDILYAEVEAMRIDPAALAYIDDLVELAYGTADALERLESGRAARALGARDMHPEAVPLLRSMVETCLDAADAEDAQLVSPGDEPELVLALADDDTPVTVVGDSDSARRLRRRALIREVTTMPESAPASRRVWLVSVVGMPASEALERVDEILVGLGSNELAVVVGAASVLCDALKRGPEENARVGTLRLRCLASALRLPRGLWRAAHRQALGVWIAAGRAEIDEPLVTDLAGPASEALDFDALAADILGALTRSGRRAYRYLRRHRLSDILAGSAVVPHGICAERLHTTAPAEDIDRVRAATVETSAAARTLDVLVVPAAAGGWQVRHQSLGQLLDNRRLRMVRGSRIDPGHGRPGGTVPVRSAAGEHDNLRLDPLDVEKLYPRAARTEPGDIVFCERPRPTARVDETGGALIASPSRVLRLDPALGIGPRAVAALINQLPASGSEWKSWIVPVLDHDEATLLEDVLAEAVAYESVLRRKLEASAELCRALIEGIAAGTVSLRTPEEVLS